MSIHSCLLLARLLICITGTAGLQLHSLASAASQDETMQSSKPASLTCSCQNKPAHSSKLDPHGSEEQILAELQLAKQHVAALEASLATFRSRAADVFPVNKTSEQEVSLATLKSKAHHVVAKRSHSDQSPEPQSSHWVSTYSQRITRRVCLGIFVLLLTLYAIRTVQNYEGDESDNEWYHNNACLTKVLLVVSVNWLSFGIGVFTDIMYFTDDSRNLTVIESAYLNSQIITSVGYGDFTPATELGTIFMTFYALMAVCLFATLTQHMIMWYIEMSGDTSHEHDLRTVLAPLLACQVFGTLFYAYYPGEDLTIWQSMNLSVITFLSVGFGDISPKTTVGQFVASIWMVVGVVCLGKAVVDATKSLFVHRRNLRSQAAALKAFDQLDKTHKGSIDKLQFLSFELVQEGLEQSTIETIMAKFDEFDLEHNGTLDFKEFKAYVDSVDK